MNWKRIIKDSRIQPKHGQYSDWKDQIAKECYRQCVYCSIGEQPWGGIDHYHIDHFRPMSRFDTLKDVITNLYYSCPVCNRFKSDDWPNDNENLDEICYPDPSEWDYNDIFEVDQSSFYLIGNNRAASYIIERLYLNRPQLIYERREHFLNVYCQKVLSEGRKLAIETDDSSFLREMAWLNSSIADHIRSRHSVSPYRLAEIQKPKSSHQLTGRVH